jgi:mannose-6-phosphate isomerase-like protein (cupin superfamily)
VSCTEDRYLGDGGEVSATYRAAGMPAELVQSPGNEISYLATHASTDGEFGLYKVDMGPRAPGPATHFHCSISESFYVLSGEVALYDGEDWIAAGPGDFLYVPVGGLHAFRNVTARPNSMLLLFAPGAPREEYFERLGEMVERGGEEFEEFLVRHDSFFVDRPG